MTSAWLRPDCGYPRREVTGRNMKIDRTRPQSTGSVAPASAVQAASRAYGAQDATAATAPRPMADVATIAGLSDTDLTPKVRQALDMLMNEVQRMREELS